MNVERALQLNTAALAVLGAVFLALGHENFLLPLMLGIAAVASVTLGWIFPWLKLNRTIANIIALAAVAWSLRDFLRMGTSGQLLAIADMLVYLQIVLLLQDKTTRVYWQLIVLSLLQVVVSAALNLGAHFGALVAVYMALSLATMVLLCVQREWKRFSARPKPTVEPPSPIWERLLAPPTYSSPKDAPQTAAVAGRGILIRQTAILAAATIVFAAVFFYATPRLGEGAWTSMRTRWAGMTTGFTPEASLNDFGRIHQNNQPVMRVAFTRMVDDKPYPLVSEPYFNGTALTQYVQDKGGHRWIAAERQRQWSRFLELSPPPSTVVRTASMIRQDIVLESFSSPLVFAVLPVQELTDTPRELRFARFTNRIFRSQPAEDFVQPREFRYAFGTSSLRNGRQVHGIPHHNPLSTGIDQTFHKVELSELTQFDERRFAGLKALAEQILIDEGLTDAPLLEKVQALEQHFQAPGVYQYSLSLDYVRDENLDPIEDFVVNHRQGHCEFFASALIMMLRSQGIPARMVVGYRGGEFNSLGDYYLVRQKHAHTWVEALLPAGEVPVWEIAGVPSRGGTWYRLDPTPPSFQAVMSGAEQGPMDRVGEAFDYIELLWRDYVLGLTASKQRENIFDPAANRTLGSLPEWLESRNMRAIVREAAANLGIPLPPRDRSGQRAFDWTGIWLVGIVMALLLGAHVFLAIARRGWWLMRWARQARVRATNTPPQFYRRLESLLARMRLRRASGQTPRELADAAAQRLNNGNGNSGDASRLPAEIVEAYYRVRFGGDALDKSEIETVERALAQLAPAVSQAHP